jgi:hypothetical protein
MEDPQAAADVRADLLCDENATAWQRVCCQAVGVGAMVSLYLGAVLERRVQQVRLLPGETPRIEVKDS